MLIGFEFRRREIGGGGKGIRTPDLLIANETLYQLSYTPKVDDNIMRRKFSPTNLRLSPLVKVNPCVYRAVPFEINQAQSLPARLGLHWRT